MLSTQDFHHVIQHAPLVSIDLVVLDAHRNMLLGQRCNAPAQGAWFVPGGRIFKGELLAAAMHRTLMAELGTAATGLTPEWLGLYEHHYPDCATSPDISTHYVVLAHKVVLPEGWCCELPKQQHAHYRWQPLAEVATAADVHVHSRWYAQDLLNLPRDARELP